MERKIYILILITFLSLLTQAQTTNKQKIYNAYLKGDMVTWKHTVDTMLKVKVQSDDYKFELLNYLYGYIGWCLGNGKKPEARIYLDKAELIIADLEKRKINLSMVNAYQSAFNGYNIALDLYKMIFFGKRSIKHAETALKLNTNNYFAHLQVGNIDFYKPATFGGDKYKAINNYGKAQKLIENQYFKTKDDWNYLNILVSIARAYTELGKYQEAKKYYESILKIEPNFDWVKNKLLPELNKKIKNGK
jgi:tetratricopeptide (TPR) repeat protein